MLDNKSITSKNAKRTWPKVVSGRIIAPGSLILLFILVFWVAIRTKSSSNREVDETVLLSIPPAALDLGAVWEDEKFEWTVPIKNNEAKAMEISAFSTSCNCLSIDPKSLVIGPGESHELHLLINLTKQIKPSGEVSVRIYPRIKEVPGTELAGRRPPNWIVKGKVQRVFDVKRYYYLGRYSELLQSIPATSIPMEILSPLESLSVECSLPNLKGTVELPPSGKGKTELRLTQTGSMSKGELEGTVSLKGMSKGGKRLPERKLTIAGAIVPDVEAVPAMVQVGGRRLGERFAREVVLRSITGRSLRDVRAMAVGEGLSVEKIGAGRFCVRQIVTGIGDRTNQVQFNTESGGQPTVIMVPVNYTGIERE